MDVDPIFTLIEKNAVVVAFDLAANWARVRALMKRWERMDLADASIVVMSEVRPKSQVLTVDRKDFTIYRRNDRQVIDFIAPPQK